VPKKAITTLLAAVFLMSGAALAEEPTAPTPPAPPKAETPPSPPAPPAETQTASEEEQKVVCKKMDPPLGSRMGGKKVCHTVADWRRINETAKDTVNEIQNSDTRGPPGS